jgi:hypothetical protein
LQGYATRLRVLDTQVRRLLRRRLPIVPRNSPIIVPHTFGAVLIPLGTNIALIAGWLGQEFALASRHPDVYRDGVPNVVVIVHLTKNDKLYRKMTLPRT